MTTDIRPLVALNMFLSTYLCACDPTPPSLPEAPASNSSTSADQPEATSNIGEAETSGTVGTGADTAEDDVNAYIHGLGHLTIPPASPATAIECQDDDCLQDGPKGDYTCDYTYYSVTENFDEFVVFEPNSATLWPGSLVKGADASHGLLTAVGLPRAPLTFSVSLPGINESPIGVLATPSLSSYREALKEILAGGHDGKTPANFSFELRQVFSEAEMSLALGTSVGWPGGSSVKSMFSHDTEQSKTQVLANFVQSYFTVDVDTPLAPADWFAPGVTVDELAAFMGVDNPPMYVQSLTYGRRAVFSIESSHSFEEVHAALTAAIQAAVNVDFDVAYKDKKLLEESTMQVFVLGGSAEDGIHAVDGFSGLLEYIKRGAEFSKDSPAAPIGYKLAYLDNTGTRFAYTTDFAEADCSFNPPDKVRVTLDEIHFHKNGCNWKDGSCKQTYKIWVETPSGKTVVASQDVPSFIDDGQSVGLGVVEDLILPDEPGSWLTVGFSADEDGLTVQTAKKFVYDGGWQGFGEQGITAKTPANSNEDLDVTLWFELSEL